MEKDEHASKEKLAESPPEIPSLGHSSGKYGSSVEKRTQGDRLLEPPSSMAEFVEKTLKEQKGAIPTTAMSKAEEEVVEMWNSRDKFQMDETNMRIVLIAPLLNEGSTRDPKWQQWMGKHDLIIHEDDVDLLMKNKELLFILDTFDIVVEDVHTKFSTMKTDDYNQMTNLLKKVEKVDELGKAMIVANDNPIFVTFCDDLKKNKEIKDSRVSRLMALFTIKQYFQYVKDIVIYEKKILATPKKLIENDKKGHFCFAQAFFENKRGQKLYNDGGSQTGEFKDEKKRLVSLNSKKNEGPDLVSESETDSDSDSLHEEASNTAQLDVGPNRRHVVGERMNRVPNPNAALFIPKDRRKIHASVLNPNAASFIPGAKNSGVGASGSPTPQPALTLPSSMAHETRMAAPRRGLSRMQPVDHQHGMMAVPTAEGVPQYGDASSKSAPGATKPMTRLDAGISAATHSTRNDASRSQMVQGGEGGARDEFDDVEQLHEEASNTAQLDVGPNRRQVVEESMNRATRKKHASVLNPNAASFFPRAIRKKHASVLNPNAASFIPGAKNSGVGTSGSPTNQPALTLPSSMAHETRMAAPGSWTMSAPRIQPVDHQHGMMTAPTAEGVPQYGAIPPNMQDAQHQMWQQQGAAARPQHQLQQQQMLGRRQYMEQQVARPRNSFEQQGQRETARNAFQGHIQGHEELVDGEEDEEHPCVICHDEMSGDNTLEIECGHIFHIHCLLEWLKQQRTCPICRRRTYYSSHK